MNPEINSAFCKIILLSLNWLKLMKKIKLTSAKLVRHFSNSESTKWQEQDADHASTFGLSSILLTELLNGPQSTQFLIRAEMCLVTDRTFEMDESVPLGPNEN